MSKRQFFIRTVVQVVIVVTMVASILLGIINYADGESNYLMSAFTCFVLLIITFVPSYINNNTRIIVPAALQIMIVIFTFLAMYFGEIFRFYDKFFWWDEMLHSTSGIMLGIIGFLLFYSLNRDNNVIFEVSTSGLLLFAFCFAMTCGVVWEFFEFLMDFFTDSNMQKSVYVHSVTDLELYFKTYVNKYGRVMDPGLFDTMKDLLLDAAGALTSAFVGYIYVKRQGRKEAVMEIERRNKVK